MIGKETNQCIFDRGIDIDIKLYIQSEKKETVHYLIYEKNI